MCYSIRIARNNGIKPHGFAPRKDKNSSVPKKPSQEAIEQKKRNRLKKSDPERALALFNEEKKAKQEKRLEAAQDAVDAHFKQRGKQNGERRAA